MPFDCPEDVPYIYCRRIDREICWILSAHWISSNHDRFRFPAEHTAITLLRYEVKQYASVGLPLALFLLRQRGVDNSSGADVQTCVNHTNTSIHSNAPANTMLTSNSKCNWINGMTSANYARLSGGPSAQHTQLCIRDWAIEQCVRETCVRTRAHIKRINTPHSWCRLRFRWRLAVCAGRCQAAACDTHQHQHHAQPHTHPNKLTRTHAVHNI